MGVPFTEAIDIWSVGVILCELWTAETLFRSDDVAGLVREMIQLLGPLPRHVYSDGKFFHPLCAEAQSVQTTEAELFDLNDDKGFVTVAGCHVLICF